MKIAIDARYLNATPSPLGQYCENLIEHLAQADQENEYVVFPHASYHKTLRLGGNFTIRPVRSRPISWRCLFRFHATLQRLEVDVLHSLYPVVPMGWRGATLVTVHDLKPLMLNEMETRRSRLAGRVEETLARRVFPYAVKRATWIATVSSSTREGLGRLFPETFHKTIVARSGVDPAYLSPLEDATREMVLSKYEPPARYFFYTGSARPSKNVAKMLTAFAYLRNSSEAFEPLHFILDLPPGRWLQEARRLARRLRLEDVVHFYEMVTDQERRVLYAGAELVCFLCKGEGFGFPVLEAQAMGAPVLAADEGALPEIAGSGALLANPDHVPSIVEGMKRAVSDADLRRDLIESGRLNVQKYHWRKTAEQIRDIYNLLLN